MSQSVRTTQRHLAVNLIERRGIMRLSDLKDHGVNPATLARLVDEGVLIRPSLGLYEVANANVGISHSLAEVAVRAPKCTVCLISALQFHEITLQVPRSVWVAIGSRDRKPAIDYPPTRVVRFGPKAQALGVEIHDVDRVPVKIFNPAKSIVDCFRFRSSVGLAVALEALRMGWRSSKAAPSEIEKYAKVLRIWSIVRPYLESVAADEG